MILVDTSVWIELIREKRRAALTDDDLLEFTTCGPIMQEVLQGLRPGIESEAFRFAFEAVPLLSDPVPVRLYTAAAGIYQLGRRRGYAVRSSVDCLIAAIAIENSVPVWHRDRDFATISRYTALEAFESRPAR